MSHHNNFRMAGYSLIEMLVVISITMMVALPLTLFAIKGYSSFNFLQIQSDTSTDLSALMQRVTKVVRGATTVETASSNSLVIYGYFSPQDTVIKKIRYFVDGRNLNIGVTPPSGTAPNFTYPPANEKITTTRIDLTNGSTPLFTYYDDAGNLLTGSFTPSQVKVVGVYVSANPNDKQNRSPVSVSTKVTLRNQKVNL